MKILVTGGAGFIGTNICLSLKSKYPTFQIIAFDNYSRTGSESNVFDLKSRGIKVVKGDIRNISNLENEGRFDILIEAAAEPSVSSGINNSPDFVVDNNLIGAINCFKLAHKHNAKIIFLSTSRVYPYKLIDNANYNEGVKRYDLNADQDLEGISTAGISEKLSLYGPRSFYGYTKLAAEQLLLEYAEFYNLQTAITRFGVVGGPRQMGKSDQGIVALWMANHLWNQPLQYIGYGGFGKQVRDVLNIHDLVDLIDFQIHNTEVFRGKVYNAGGSLKNSASLIEMTELCEDITGNKISIKSNTVGRQADLKYYVSDNSKITRETGWEPKINISQTFEETYNWLLKNETELKSYFIK